MKDLFGPRVGKSLKKDLSHGQIIRDILSISAPQKTKRKDIPSKKGTLPVVKPETYLWYPEILL